MQVRSVMTQNLKDIPPTTTLQDAAEKMKSLDVGALPVCENNRLVGILTDRDIAVRAVAAGKDPKRTKASDVMTDDVYCCYAGDDVRVAARIMEDKQIRRLLVVDSNSRPIGIVSLGDIAQRMSGDGISAEILERVSEPSQPHA